MVEKKTVFDHIEYLKEDLLETEEKLRNAHWELNLLRDLLARECDEKVILEYIKARSKHHQITGLDY